MSVQDTMLENQILFSRLDVVKKISKNIIEKNNFPLAIATFSREMQIHLPLSSDIFLQENVINGISLHQYGGGSDLYKAISRISEIYKNHKNLHIIVFSDMEFFEEKTNNFSIPKNFHIDFV